MLTIYETATYNQLSYKFMAELYQILPNKADGDIIDHMASLCLYTVQAKFIALNPLPAAPFDGCRLNKATQERADKQIDRQRYD